MTRVKSVTAPPQPPRSNLLKVAGHGTRPAEVSPVARFLTGFQVDPRSIIFGERMLAGIEKGYFAEMFGEPVDVVKIDSVGDKHLCLDVDDLSPAALIGVTSLFDGSVSATIGYWRNRAGIPAKESQRVKFQGQPMDANFNGDRMDAEAVEIAVRLIRENEAVVDSTKLIVFKGTASGRIYKIIHKGFDPVRLEKATGKFLEMMGLPQYKINTAKDKYGSFAWIEYCDHHALDADNIGELMGEDNVYKFGQYFGWCYALGIFDFTGENFFIRKTPDVSILTRIDHETAFVPYPGDFNSNYSEFFSSLAMSPSFHRMFFSIIMSHFDQFINGIDLVTRHFQDTGGGKDLGEILAGIVRDALIAKGVRRRHLFQSTRYYLQGERVGQLQGVIPYYSTPVDDLSIMCLAQRIESLKAGLREA